jgi:hypothetical protein
MANLRTAVKNIPVLGSLAGWVYRKFIPSQAPEAFSGSATYWEKRYADGGDSGVGSYNFLAEFKAEVINAFVQAHDVQTVIEFGCGDGNQLGLAKYPAYLGFDVSSTVIAQCQRRFRSDPGKKFRTLDEYSGETADLALSLDVIYHLVEDEVFESYMQTLFAASNRYIAVYSSNTDDNQGFENSHIRHRKFSRWIEARLPNCKLVQHIPNRYPYRGDHRKGSFADFFIYEKTELPSIAAPDV